MDAIEIHSKRTEETNYTFWNTNSSELVPILLVSY